MLLLCPQLRLPITRDTGDSSAYSASDAVGDAGAVIVKLTFGLLGFAFSVLLLALGFEVLDDADVLLLSWAMIKEESIPQNQSNLQQTPFQNQ
jgi:hypothetical protein